MSKQSKKTVLSVLIGIVLVGLGLLIMGSSVTAPTNGKNVTYSEINQEVQDEEAILLDVRTPAEFAESHVVGAINYDVELIRVGEVPTDKDAKYYLYCRTGNRSSQAKTLLENLGFTNVVDLGGLTDMQNLGAEFIAS